MFNISARIVLFVTLIIFTLSGCINNNPFIAPTTSNETNKSIKKSGFSIKSSKAKSIKFHEDIIFEFELNVEKTAEKYANHYSTQNGERETTSCFIESNVTNSNSSFKARLRKLESGWELERGDNDVFFPDDEGSHTFEYREGVNVTFSFTASEDDLVNASISFDGSYIEQTSSPNPLTTVRSSCYNPEIHYYGRYSYKDIYRYSPVESSLNSTFPTLTLDVSTDKDYYYVGDLVTFTSSIDFDGYTNIDRSWKVDFPEHGSHSVSDPTIQLGVIDSDLGLTKVVATLTEYPELFVELNITVECLPDEEEVNGVCQRKQIENCEEDPGDFLVFSTSNFGIKSNDCDTDQQPEEELCSTVTPSDLSSINSDLISVNSSLNKISKESFNQVNRLNNQIENLQNKVSGFTTQANSQQKLLDKQTERIELIEFLNQGILELNQKKDQLRSSVNTTLGANISFEVSEVPSSLSEYRDSIVYLDDKFKVLVNEKNTHQLAKAVGVIADEIQLFNLLVDDYLSGRLVNLQPESDTEDLVRIEKLTKPHQFIKYLHNRINQHLSSYDKKFNRVSSDFDTVLNNLSVGENILYDQSIDTLRNLQQEAQKLANSLGVEITPQGVVLLQDGFTIQSNETIRDRIRSRMLDLYPEYREGGENAHLTEASVDTALDIFSTFAFDLETTIQDLPEQVLIDFTIGKVFKVAKLTTKLIDIAPPSLKSRLIDFSVVVKEKAIKVLDDGIKWVNDRFKFDGLCLCTAGGPNNLPNANDIRTTKKEFNQSHRDVKKSSIKIEQIPVGNVNFLSVYDLVPTHGRTLSNNKWKKLKKDISSKGEITEPIHYVLNSKGEKIVVDGHHRLRAAKELGIRDVPTQEYKMPYSKSYQTESDLEPYYGGWN